MPTTNARNVPMGIRTKIMELAFCVCLHAKLATQTTLVLLASHRCIMELQEPTRNVSSRQWLIVMNMT